MIGSLMRHVISGQQCVVVGRAKLVHENPVRHGRPTSWLIVSIGWHEGLKFVHQSELEAAQ